MRCPRPIWTLAALLVPAAAHAFVRTTTEDGKHFLWWPTRSVGYFIQQDCALRPSMSGGEIVWNQLPPEVADAGESAASYTAACHAAIEASFGSWQAAGDAGCTNLRLPYLGDTAVREVGYQPDASENINSVLFQPATCDDVLAPSDPCWNDGDCDTAHADLPCFSHGDEVIALTTTTYEPDDGTLLDADVELNNAPGVFDFSAEQPGSPLADTWDIENAVTHEAGHFIGLAHNCGTLNAPACTPTLEQGVMYANAAPGETTKRVLKPDDIDAVCHVYPKGLSTAIVNLEDEADAGEVRITGGFATSCSTGGGGTAWFALLTLALLRRRHPTAT